MKFNFFSSSVLFTDLEQWAVKEAVRGRETGIGTVTDTTVIGVFRYCYSFIIRFCVVN